MNVDRVVDATVQIRFGGEPIGSGFRFYRDDIVVTNAHIFPEIPTDVPITGVIDPDTSVELDLEDLSPEPWADGSDYAILRAPEGFSVDSETLSPGPEEPVRGDRVYFTGHPFDISPTLLFSGHVSGPHPRGFYIDGSVNFRNSGGPVVDGDTGDVVGIVTESKMFQNEEIEEIIDHFYGVQQQLSRIRDVHDTTINGVGVESLAIDAIQEIQDAVDILTDNISSGIGVGYGIEYVLEGIEGLDI